MSEAHLKTPLDAYLANYSADQHVARLSSIAKSLDPKKHSDRLQEVCTLLASKYKDGRDVAGFKDFAAKYFEKGVHVELDQEFITEREKKTSGELEALQVNLGQATNSLEKPKIRKALFELGEFYATMGNLQNSMKCVTRSRESLTEDLHTAQMCNLAVKVNVFRGNYAVFSPYVTRAEQLGDRLTDDSYTYFKLASALLQLEKRNYKSCASTLLRLRRRRETPVNTEIANHFFNAGDLVLLASLCALATFSRAELSAFLALPDYKIMLEAEPVTRALVQNFYDCKYAAALQALDEITYRVKLDYFMSPHANNLLRIIRESAIKQYASPYLNLDLNKMASAFKCDQQQIQREVAALIIKGDIKGRIDKAAGVLRASVANERANTFNNVLDAGEQFCEETEACLRLLSMQRNSVAVHPKHIARPKGDDHRGERGGPQRHR